MIIETDPKWLKQSEALLRWLPNLDGAEKVVEEFSAEHPYVRNVGYRFVDGCVTIAVCLEDFRYVSSRKEMVKFMEDLARELNRRLAVAGKPQFDMATLWEEK